MVHPRIQQCSSCHAHSTMAFSEDSFEGLLIDGVKLTEKILGKGAYGKVIEVVWNGTVCAAKQVHEIFIEEVSPAERARVVKDFEREFQTWAKLRHPNIVILLGVFFIKDSPRIVLEKMDTSLRLYLEKHTKVDFPLIHKIDVLKQVAQGLCYLHNQNPPLVHHDLSPNNILLNEISFTTKLTDFGMTRAISPSALTRMSSIKGTLTFMAPESLRSQPRYNDKLDTFSYGNIIICTVTHKWPIPCESTYYEGEKLVALTEYERREEYMKLFNDDESKILAPIVKQCLENRPDRRPTSLTLVDEINAASLTDNFLQTEAKTWSQQMLELKNERQQLCNQVVSCQGSIKELQERIIAEEEEKSALQRTNTHLLEEKSTLQEMNTHLAEEKRTLQGRTKRLVEEKNTLQTLCTHLQGANTCLQKDKKAFQTRCAHLQDASTRLQQELKSFQESYSRVNLEIMQLKATALCPDVKTQLEEVHPLLDARLQENDIWYLIDIQWMKQWKKYVGFDSWDLSQVGDDSASPGPVDNSNLLLDLDDDLKDLLMEDLDYSLIPETAWDKLTTWYGIAEGSRAIARKVIQWGACVKKLKVEVYPVRLELGVHPRKEGEKTIFRGFSRVDRMSAVKAVIVKKFDLPTNKDTRLWHQFMNDSCVEVKDDDMLQESGIYTGQLMFLEVKKDDGTWPRDTYMQNTAKSPETAGASRSSSFYTRSSSGGGGSSGSLFGSYGRGSADPGLCGLQNLGNTCFMNSIMQCLSNTEPLTDYFLSKPYLKHINNKNPLGMGGQLAYAFGGLLSEMWKGKYSYTAPRGLKLIIDHHTAQFTRDGHLDSQELLAFLLDSLHEDLNQILNKPYVDMSIQNEGGRTDQDIARETWEKNLLRDRSVIVNLFQGQLKSTFVCQDCKNVSRVLNPFMYLSLPLPIEKPRWLTVHLVRLDPAAGIERYKLRLPKQGSIGHLQEELGKLSGVDHTKMVTIDVYQHRFHRIYERKDGLNHILDRDDIFVYEVPISSANDPDWVFVPVYHREQYTKTYNYSYSGGSYTQSYTRLFGLPLLVTVSRQNTTYQGLHDAIMSQCSRYVKRPPEVKGEPRMFEILAVNGYGSQAILRFKDDDKPLKLGVLGNIYIGCDWEESWKDKCYDEDKSLETVDHGSMEASVKLQKKGISINDCIELFTSANKLGDDDLRYCSHCKDRRQTTRKFDLWKLPEILVIHLKRFSHDKEERTKNDELIDFPLEIDLSDFVVNKDHPSSMYELYAVTNHYSGMGGGHYTAFAMNYENGKWYNFDDSHVSETDSSHVVTSAAYILYFRRKDTRSPRKSLSMDQSGETSWKHGEDEPDEAEECDE